MTPPPHREPVADPTTGEIRILADRCKTCILGPASTRLPLSPKRLRGLLADAEGGHVVCHRTLSEMTPPRVKPAICRGHANAFGLPPMVKLALALGIGRLVEQPDHD